MTEAEHQHLTEIEDLVRWEQMSTRLAVALLPPERAVSGKNLADVRTGVQALREALAALETLREGWQGRVDKLRAAPQFRENQC